ncbi:MAG: hypothetical protein LBI74_01485 [Synergistaceae bacterium]|jgi:predicted transposase/invertase (TIGR01784 family)|nr:hypothetical protein [Synergistaceae bacterium]
MITAKGGALIRKSLLVVEDVPVRNEEDRLLQELRERSRLEFENAVSAAELRGRQEGVEEGRRMGIREGIRATARAMLARNLPVTFVSEISGLSIEEIRVL